MIALLRGVLLDTLDANGAEAAAAAIMVPQLFDHELREIELTKPGDPMGWPPEPTVETLTGINAQDHGGGYLRIDMVAPPEPGKPKPIPAAANDDTGTQAVVSVVGED